MDDPVAVAYAQALKLLARREHGRAELAQKLSRRGREQTHIEQALQRLGEAGYQSDARYAQARAAELQRRRYGPLRAQAELRARGVDEQAIAEAVQVDDEAWYRACRAARAHVFGRQSPATVRELSRLQRQLQMRGFTGAQIRAALGKDNSDDA